MSKWAGMTFAKFEEVKGFVPDKVVVIDTETTGLGEENNEVLSLSIVDYNGEVLFDHLIKPQKRVRWPNAQEIHGISPADVKNEKTLLEYENELRGFFDGSYLVVGYNAPFDVGMLRASGLDIHGIKAFDVMREAEKMNGRVTKLPECARIFGYEEFEAHGSLADAKATAYCFKRLMEDEGYLKIRELESSGLSTSNARIIAAEKTAKQAGSGCMLPAMIAVLVPILAIVAVAAAWLA